MCTATLARIFLFVFNLIFWLAGAALLAIGIWMKVDPTIVNFFHAVNIDKSDGLIDNAAILFIVVGIIVFVIGFLGCCGAWKKNQWMLFLYAFLVLIVVIVEIAGAVLAVIYRSRVEKKLQEVMYREVREEYADKNSTVGEAWDYLQVASKCCGTYNYTDYMGSKWMNDTRNGTVPITCCVLTNSDHHNPIPINFKRCQNDAKSSVAVSEYLHTEGCYDKTLDWFKSHSLILIIIAFIVALIQVAGFFAACCLRLQLKREGTAKA